MNPLNNKNIIFVLGSLELGGSEKQAINLATYLLNEQKCNVQFIGFSNPGKVAQICDQLKIPWRILENPLGYNSGLSRNIKLFNFLLEIRKTRPDILLPYTTTPNIACGLIWKFTGAKTCIWNQRDQGIESFDPIIGKKALLRTPWFVSNSIGGKEYLTNNLGVDPEKVAIIHNGINLPSKKTPPERINHQVVINCCMIGNLSQHKDHATLLKAWQFVVRHFKDKEIIPTLLLAGRFDSNEKSLRTLAEELEILDHVSFLGQVDDIPGLLQTVDIGVFSSRSEGSPNGVLECMAQGLPVVGTDIPGIREALGVDGIHFLASTQDSIRFSELVIELIEDREKRIRFGELNRERVKKEFSNEKMLQETTSFLFKALQ